MATSTSVSMAQKPSETLAGKKRKKKQNDLVRGKASATSCQEKMPAALWSRTTGDYFLESLLL